MAAANQSSVDRRAKKSGGVCRSERSLFAVEDKGSLRVVDEGLQPTEGRTP
jgi:hypothetical protein